jgi:alanine transaminase
MGQVMVDLMVNPPKSGKCDEEVVKQYKKERQVTMAGLKRRLKIVNKLLNSMDHVSSVAIEGALYAFPKINLS